MPRSTGARLHVLSAVLAAASVALGACSSSSPASAGGGGSAGTTPGDAGGTTTDAGADAVAFAAATPATYVAKVKNILVGLPATDTEVQAVAADPTQLKGLVTGWLKLPGYQTKMKRFFELAFQQTQITAVDFADQAFPKQIDINATTTPLLVQNAQQSFPLTMLTLLAQGRPLTDATSTTQLMMTTAMKEMYAFLDVWEVDDAGKVTDGFKVAHPKTPIVVEASQGPIAIADTLDPTSPSYMHWYDPDVATNDMNVAGCTTDPIVYDPPSGITLHYLLQGALDGHKNATTGGLNCPPSGGSATAAQLQPGDYTDWTLVTIRQPKGVETSTPFYDLPTLRAAKELVLSIPRVGFYSTPAFFANWQTNTSNQMRVTMNQTLIVALGAQVDGSDPTHPATTPGLDTVHASQAACIACHQTLDPLRSILSATFSWNYHTQLDPMLTAQKGLFAFRGVMTNVASTSDLGQTLGTHPLFAAAWAQKLCTYVNSAPCDVDDPEFQRVVTAFTTSGYMWNTLVTELFSSPLVTNASPTATSMKNGEVIAVSRRDHLCAALNARLGFTDVCGLDAVTRKQQQAAVAQIASGLPSDGYGRGATMPVLPNQPTLFYRAGTENICEAVAAQVIDVKAAAAVPGVMTWSSTSPEAAVADFVNIVMGLVTSDPRSSPAITLLKQHFAAAVQQGATASDALKSTFVTACLAPSSISIGL
jgi:hypothetical protein